MHSDVSQLMKSLAEKARRAKGEALSFSADNRNQALEAAASGLRTRKAELLSENQKDLAHARKQQVKEAFCERLTLDEARIEAMASALETIARLPDPLGRIIWQSERPNGLVIHRVTVPIGVIGMIYESRPNVTADAAALSIKSGNAVILRCGSETVHSARFITTIIREALAKSGLDENIVQIIPTTDRQAVGEMLSQPGLVDLVVPRGGRSLVERVMAEAKTPVLAHLEGLCHTYIDRDADDTKAVSVTVNAKMRRPGICGATETVLVHRAKADSVLPALIDALHAKNCVIRGDEAVCAFHEAVEKASAQDWQTEYLEAIIAIRLVSSMDEALLHIAQYGSHHTEAIITEDEKRAARFMQNVDSAIICHNASTQFADGGEFGLGAEIGIATGKMPPRGPIGANELTSYKYLLYGNGQCRP